MFLLNTYKLLSSKDVSIHASTNVVESISPGEKVLLFH